MLYTSKQTRGYTIVEASVAIATIALIVLIASFAIKDATVSEDALAKVSILTIRDIEVRSHREKSVYISAQQVVETISTLNNVEVTSGESTVYSQVSILVNNDTVILATKAKNDCWLLQIKSAPSANYIAETWFLVQDYANSQDSTCQAREMPAPEDRDYMLENGPDRPVLS